VRYAKWQKMHLRNTCVPFGHTFPLIFYLDGCKLHMIMSINFHIRKLQTHHSSDFVWCHLSLCSKIFSPPFNYSDNTKQQQQQQLILCLLQLKAVYISVHLFLWTGVMCRRMRCITKMLAYHIRKTLLIPSLSWLWFWRIISQPCCMIAEDRYVVWQQSQRSLTWHLHDLYYYLLQKYPYLILQRDYSWRVRFQTSQIHCNIWDA
jgi:hypothetical protein